MRKKILNNSFLSGLFIPVAIVLIGAIIIYGITTLLTSEKSYRDLVKELQTKTFGNRWVAAFELSKYLAHSKIPPEEIPWLIENLAVTYDQSTDARTRVFIIMAVGTLKTPLIQPLLMKALNDPDPEVKFHALVSIGNTKIDSQQFDWSVVKQHLKSEDPGLRQVSALTLASHQVPNVVDDLESLLNDSEVSVRYAAATSLIYYQRPLALPLLREILFLKGEEGNQGATPKQINNNDEKNNTEAMSFNARQVEDLKLNVINALGKTSWDALNPELESLIANEKNISVSTKAREVLKTLNN